MKNNIVNIIADAIYECYKYNRQSMTAQELAQIFPKQGSIFEELYQKEAHHD